MTIGEIMKEAAEFAAQTSSEGIGGPFGAAVIKDGIIISMASNRVLKDNDPTAHAEIVAIREACKALETYDLSSCEIVATGAPCPMCLSAIIWANIKKVYYCNDYDEAAQIGFRDDSIFQYLRRTKDSETDPVVLERVEVPEGKMLYDQYSKNNKTIY